MKKLLVTLALGASSFSAFAITPLWLRDVNISPDGKEIVFCYKGDIYKEEFYKLKYCSTVVYMVPRA